MLTNEGRALYPEVAAAEEAYTAARKALEAAMALQFPKGRRVLVIHSRGSFRGEVVRTDDYRVYVRNESTGKVSGRYPLFDTDELPSIRLLG